MAIFNVSNQSQLEAALRDASGGDEIRLAGGDYGELNLKGMQFSSEVTITSVNPGDMASFSKLRMDDTSNVTLNAIEFDYEYSRGDGENVSKFQIENSTDIKITNSIFDGDILSGTGTEGDGSGYGRGLHIKGSEGVEIINTEFHSWWKAVSIGTSTDVSMIGNNIHTIRSDGINIGRSHDVLIENNYIHDFQAALGSDDHRDMIQIKRSSEDGSSGITIRSNVFDMGDGDHTQTIFAGGDNANPNDPTDWHRDIVIDNNLIYNSHTHGITFSLTDGLTVTNNTLISIPREGKGGITIPKINITSDSKNVTIEGNIADGVNKYEGQSGWTVKNNVDIQNDDPSDAGYYDDMFVYYATTQKNGYNQFGIKDGSLADQLNAGSSLADLLPMSYEDWAGAATSVVVVPEAESGSGSGEETGSGTGEETNSGGTEGAETGSGSTGGSEEGETGSDGSENNETGSGSTGGVIVDQSGLIFDDYVLDIAALTEGDQARLIGDASVVGTGTDAVIQLDGDGDRVKLGHLTEFEESEQLAFMVEFTRDEADGSTQRLVWNKGHVGLTLTDDGLIAHAATADGKFTGFEVEDIGLNDTDTHRIIMMVDQEEDRMQVLVDDVLVLDETNFDFEIVEGSHGGRQWGWNLGTKSREVDGEISAFAIDDDVDFVNPVAFQADEFLV